MDTMKLDESIEAIFRNTLRVHGKSKNLDWIKIASIRTARFIESLNGNMICDSCGATMHIIENTYYGCSECGNTRAL